MAQLFSSLGVPFLTLLAYYLKLGSQCWNLGFKVQVFRVLICLLLLGVGDFVKYIVWVCVLEPMRG